jgi:hypothetical protein
MDITLEPPFTELPKYCQWSIVYVLYFLEATHSGPFYTTNATGFFPGISNYPGWPHRENFEDIGPSERHVYDGEPWGHEEHGPLDWVDKYWVPVGYGEIDARRPGGNNSGWKNLEVWESLVGETPRPYDELVTEYLEDFWYMLVQGTCPEALEPEAQ